MSVLVFTFAKQRVKGADKFSCLFLGLSRISQTDVPTNLKKGLDLAQGTTDSVLKSNLNLVVLYPLVVFVL